MNILLTYTVFFAVLLIAELLYFRIAERFGIIDKPNQYSSHTRVALRGGGIIFLIGIWIWSVWFGLQYPWTLVAVTLAAGISFADDIHSLPNSVRLVVQFVAMGLMFYELDILHLNMWWIVPIALVVCVGATNIYNFMDGINGLTGGYSLTILISLLLMNGHTEFIENSFLVMSMLSVLVFCIFNFRSENKAKCFAGDVGSVSIAFILLFCIGKLILAKSDVTWLIFMIVYGVDGCLTICHRIMLHENLGETHRKHAYQLLANELGFDHVCVSALYMALQLAISLVMVYLIPDTKLWHWCYLIIVLTILSLAYFLFMKKCYHLHEEWLRER